MYYECDPIIETETGGKFLVKIKRIKGDMFETKNDYL